MSDSRIILFKIAKIAFVAVIARTAVPHRRRARQHMTGSDSSSLAFKTHRRPCLTVYRDAFKNAVAYFRFMALISLGFEADYVTYYSRGREY